MGHHLDAFVARPEVLQRLAPGICGLRILALPQGIALAPIPEALRPAGEDEPGGPPGTLVITSALAEIAAEVSRTGPIGWIETDWFGGHGESRAVLWRCGVCEDLGDVNPLLRALGVVRVPAPPSDGPLGPLVKRLVLPRLMDEWDSIGLALWRSADSAYAKATPVIE